MKHFDNNDEEDDNISLDEDFAVGENLDSDQPVFDIIFQQGLLNLALHEDHFCTQLSRYLGGKDKDLKNFQIFDNVPLEIIFGMIKDTVDRTGSRPTEGELRQLFTEQKAAMKERLNVSLDNILGTSVNNADFYRRYIKAFVQKIKFAKGMARIGNAWKENQGSKAPEVMQDVLDSIRKVDFEELNTVTVDDFDNFLNLRQNSAATKIPTGITQLDEDLLGGLPREALTVVLAGTNVGKSIFCASLGVQALKVKDERGKYRGFKVFHINLEGRPDETLFRYLANFGQVSFKNIAMGNLNDAERSRVTQAKKDIGDRLLIRNMTTFGVTIEDLVAYAKETYKDFKFDMLIVDYGQLLETSQKNLEARHVMARVFRGLSSLSNDCKCVVISPAQATRGAQETQNGGGKWGNKRGDNDPLPVLRSSDISEAFEIARVAAVILTLNRSDEEGVQGKLRVYLEKQREGEKNKTYGIYANYQMMDVITGKYYDPKATMMKENESVSDKDAIQTVDNYDPEVDDSVRIQMKREQIDILVEEYIELDKKERSRKLDWNQEKKKDKDKQNADVLAQYVQDINALQKEKKAIAIKAQEAIKIVDPEASENKLKAFEASLKDIEKSNTPENQKEEQRKMVNRYRLALKGKL